MLLFHCLLFLTTLSKGKKVTITDESGKELLAYVPSKNLKAIIDAGASTGEKKHHDDDDDDDDDDWWWDLFFGDGD